MKYGYIPDQLDFRDFKFENKLRSTQLPAKVDLRPQDCPIFDQGNLGSCTANAIISAFDFDRKKQGIYTTPGSRLFLYYQERVIEGTTAYDSGAQLRDGIKSLATWGECSEQTYPYDIARFKRKPTKAAYAEATAHKLKNYYSVDNTDLNTIKSSVAQGYPVVFGCTVYTSFESAAAANTGIILMPKKQEKIMGGHAMKVIGYDDTRKYFIVKNSWGTSWGEKGYCYMPYDYLTNGDLADDFWVLNLVQ